MNPETKLKVAAEEIKEILKKHDIAGAVQLHTPGHGEYFFHIHPSYSIAYLYQDDQVRIYSKRSDFKTLEEQKFKNVSTANMLRILTDITAINFSHLKTLSDEVDKITGAEHY